MYTEREKPGDPGNSLELLIKLADEIGIPCRTYCPTMSAKKHRGLELPYQEQANVKASASSPIMLGQLSKCCYLQSRRSVEMHSYDKELTRRSAMRDNNP
ncbi:hypothetical protein Nepgr_028836 [Nepenthes gracilis]|uniref:Uncharacterized protein n=1 Tax=Nepenthes gracilis TaxID=150966 RepID=A0AAD3TD08_NEPGR|nr:hypothetical protein Nepgr_028836 [Nepenthes gracilis]